MSISNVSLAGALRLPKANPSMGIGVVATKEIIMSNMALHFTVIKRASFIPSKVTFHLRIENIGLPGTEKGKNNHKKATKVLTTNSLLMTLPGRSLAKRIERPDAKKAIKAGMVVCRSAMAKARKNAHNTLALGSAW